MKYHNKALEDSRLHIRAEIKDAKKLTAYNSLLKDLMIRVEYKKLCCRRRSAGHIAVPVEIVSVVAQLQRQVVQRVHWTTAERSSGVRALRSTDM